MKSVREKILKLRNKEIIEIAQYFLRFQNTGTVVYSEVVEKLILDLTEDLGTNRSYTVRIIESEIGSLALEFLACYYDE